MTLIRRFWETLVEVTAWLTVPHLSDTLQKPMGLQDVFQHKPAHEYRPGESPIFRPPAGNPDDPEFVCDYTNMKGWVSCSTPENRGCWLRNENGEEMNITSNYETVVPTGVTRSYTLTVDEENFNADGLPFTAAKLFNSTYPGPWLEACWGDTIEITVINNLKKEGTSIHWHGIRQWGSMDMDGVNGITQCPIAPNDSFTYRFRATQYGTSWYHSHYSVQYADGLQGPLTIHGPSSAPFDSSKRPLIMTDWAHIAGYRALNNSKGVNATILLNGAGNAANFKSRDTKPPSTLVPTLKVPPQYQIHFDEAPPNNVTGAKRYLLRLINTSFHSTFIFSIDNHLLQVVAADFVPIVPYQNTSVLIGIGQRYNVIVEANVTGSDIPEDGNFWIRTYLAKGCSNLLANDGYEKTGVLRYDWSSTSAPTSKAWRDISRLCSDETYSSLVPVLPWTVGEPANGEPSGEQFDVKGSETSIPGFEYAFFSLERSNSSGFTPLQIKFSDPTINNLDMPPKDFNPLRVVIPESFNDSSWVYLTITGAFGNHPIHLHGHDFALLAQESHPYDPNNLPLKRDNPPRRDVVLLPSNGYIVIAFKSDNPGSWLMHCHIADHAAAGLALQVLERQKDAYAEFQPGSPRMKEVTRVCDAWKKWRSTQTDFDEEDSGI